MIIGLTFGLSCTKQEKPEFSSADTFDSQVVQDWMGLILKLTVETEGYSSPVAARTYGYIGVGLYESVRPGLPGYKTLAEQINGLNQEDIVITSEPFHWGLVANSVIAYMIKRCYPHASSKNLEAVKALEKQYQEQFKENVTPAIYGHSIRFGRDIGELITAYANTDEQKLCFAENFPDYTAPTGEGNWVPTPPNYEKALQPFWGDVRPFMNANINNTQPPAPPAFSTQPSAAFYVEAQEVYTLVQNLTPEQKAIAEFWSDEPGKSVTPPGHSLSILKQVLEKENANLGLAAEAMAKLGMALHDALIASFKAKYHYNMIRPVTYINQYIDKDFEPVFTTPPFPEFTSVHAVQSSAAAQVLTDLFGDNYSFTDYTYVNRTDITGSPRSYNSFFDFADEAAISQLYGGVHYRSSVESGIQQGKKIGQNVNTLTFR